MDPDENISNTAKEKRKYFETGLEYSRKKVCTDEVDKSSDDKVKNLLTNSSIDLDSKRKNVSDSFCGTSGLLLKGLSKVEVPINCPSVAVTKSNPNNPASAIDSAGYLTGKNVIRENKKDFNVSKSCSKDNLVEKASVTGTEIVSRLVSYDDSPTSISEDEDTPFEVTPIGSSTKIMENIASQENIKDLVSQGNLEVGEHSVKSKNEDVKLKHSEKKVATSMDIPSALGDTLSTSVVGPVVLEAFSTSVEMPKVSVDTFSTSTKLPIVLKETFSVSVEVPRVLEETFPISVKVPTVPVLKETLPISVEVPTKLEETFSTSVEGATVLKGALSTSVEVPTVLEETFPILVEVPTVLETFPISMEIPTVTKETISTLVVVPTVLEETFSTSVKVSTVLEETFPILVKVPTVLEKTISTSLVVPAVIKETVSAALESPSVLEEALSTLVEFPTENDKTFSAEVPIVFKEIFSSSVEIPTVQEVAFSTSGEIPTESEKTCISRESSDVISSLDGSITQKTPESTADIANIDIIGDILPDSSNLFSSIEPKKTNDVDSSKPRNLVSLSKKKLEMCIPSKSGRSTCKELTMQGFVPKENLEICHLKKTDKIDNEAIGLESVQNAKLEMSNSKNSVEAEITNPIGLGSVPKAHLDECAMISGDIVSNKLNEIGSFSIEKLEMCDSKFKNKSEEKTQSLKTNFAADCDIGVVKIVADIEHSTIVDLKSTHADDVLDAAVAMTASSQLPIATSAIVDNHMTLKKIVSDSLTFNEEEPSSENVSVVPPLIETGSSLPLQIFPTELKDSLNTTASSKASVSGLTTSNEGILGNFSIEPPKIRTVNKSSLQIFPAESKDSFRANTASRAFENSNLPQISASVNENSSSGKLIQEFSTGTVTSNKRDTTIKVRTLEESLKQIIPTKSSLGRTFSRGKILNIKETLKDDSSTASTFIDTRENIDSTSTFLEELDKKTETSTMDIDSSCVTPIESIIGTPSESGETSTSTSTPADSCQVSAAPSPLLKDDQNLSAVSQSLLDYESSMDTRDTDETVDPKDDAARLPQRKKKKGSSKKNVTKSVKRKTTGPILVDEDTRMSANGIGTSDIVQDEDSQGSAGTISRKETKRFRCEVIVPESTEIFTVDKVYEYIWPLEGMGEHYFIQEHISQYLGIMSFKRKYPDLRRRPIESEEKEYLRDLGLVTEMACDLGLTALRSEDLLDILFNDFPSKYEEVQKVLRERKLKQLKEKGKVDYQLANLDKSKIQEYSRKAALNAARWNAAFNRERREERKYSFDLQTFTLHMGLEGSRKLPPEATKIGSYPVAVLPGQYTDYCKKFSANELRAMPLQTVLAGPFTAEELAADLHNIDSDDESTSISFSTCAEIKETIEPEITMPAAVDPLSAEKQPRCKACNGGKDRNKEGKPEPLIICGTCRIASHPTCIDLTLGMIDKIESYCWQCMDCKTCAQCNDPDDEERMIFCDMCDRGYHIYCVGLRKVPNGRWHCKECAMCYTCGSRNPSGNEHIKNAEWQHEFKKDKDNKQLRYACTLCVPCDKYWKRRQFCYVCMKVYRSIPEDGMVRCSACPKYVHREGCSIVHETERYCNVCFKNRNRTALNHSRIIAAAKKKMALSY